MALSNLPEGEYLAHCLGLLLASFCETWTRYVNKLGFVDELEGSHYLTRQRTPEMILHKQSLWAIGYP